MTTQLNGPTISQPARAAANITPPSPITPPISMVQTAGILRRAILRDGPTRHTITLHLTHDEHANLMTVMGWAYAQTRTGVATP